MKIRRLYFRPIFQFKYNNLNLETTRMLNRYLFVIHGYFDYIIALGVM